MADEQHQQSPEPDQRNVVYVSKHPSEVAARRRRDITALILLVIGAVSLSVSIAMMVENVWAGTAIMGAVVLIVGVLLGRDT